ncbi:Hsp70 family protein [Mycolicibacterium insubricum]|uniref:Hsp70 family protein n=1 Tax=Mycolicibacterium insubricum TaxID=444597 RepID=UPI0021F27D60|nr:Hsp70 family protein [Mycolicibacterium insubricum]
MADVPGIGLSVGATRLAAVTAERGITGDAVRRLPGGFGERCSSASTRSAADSGGVGAEGAGAAPIGGFVDRVGDPIAVIDERGGAHRARTCWPVRCANIADVALGGRRRPPGLAISLPGHWSPAAVTALRHALPRYFDGTPPVLLPDYAAAVAALIRRPGLPTHGIIALCDIGGSGTSLTLLDADNGYRRVGETRRSGEFGGDLVDRTVLTHVLDALPGRLDATATSAIGTLGELRRECRDAKHRLSAATVTAVTAHLPGGPAELRLTRAELDELTAPGLRRLLDEMESLLTDHGIGPSRLAAVATVGGMRHARGDHRAVTAAARPGDHRAGTGPALAHGLSHAGGRLGYRPARPGSAADFPWSAAWVASGRRGRSCSWRSASSGPAWTSSG